MNFEPKWIAWEITRRCNLNCVHCRSSSELKIADHPDCSLEEAKRMLDDIKSYADPVMVLSGGEPLLRPDVFDIASYGTDLGMRMCLATNGTLVTEEICRNIKESGIKMVSPCPNRTHFRTGRSRIWSGIRLHSPLGNISG